MSTAAREAFINIGTSRQGSTPPPRTPAHVLDELQSLGLIGKGNGLTRKGSITHDLLWDELTTF